MKDKGFDSIPVWWSAEVAKTRIHISKSGSPKAPIDDSIRWTAPIDIDDYIFFPYYWNHWYIKSPLIY